MKKKIYYWSPFLSPIATSKAVINSAYSLVRYGSNNEVTILNFFNEFQNSKKDILRKNLKTLEYYKMHFKKYLPYKGRIKSRFSFIIFFILGLIPLVKILKKDKPDYLIVHLITSLPFILLIFFKFETKFILRISGYPKMNFLRKILWKIALKNFFLVTCPTKNTLSYIKSLNLIDPNKIKLLYDPIINISEINLKKREKINFKNYYLAVGRLTKQKNFIFLCKAFKKLVLENKSLKLLIAGNGEDENLIKKYIQANKLQKNIILLGYVENIYPYFKNSNGFILTSLWEDPGFVLMEASCCRALVLSANSWPGPVELIKDNYNGIIYENNNLDSFIHKFKQLENFKNNFNFKLNNLKFAKNFTLFNHFKEFSRIIN